MKRELSSGKLEQKEILEEHEELDAHCYRVQVRHCVVV